jgi:hypothetical protein
MGGVSAEIRSEHLMNRSLERYDYTNLLAPTGSMSLIIGK